jgi:cellulose synthase/poly-beta-1,6-N-acetylglucosamine synthase-like glycosyltransferase
MLKFIIIFCINVFLWLIGIFRVGKIHRLLNKDICTDDYKISVIIPCRNEAKKISRLLLSLIKTK